MATGSQEREAKFYVSRLDKITMRLQELKAYLVQPRLLEVNLRFDLPDDSFRATGRVLRLRQDTETRLTYKGGSQNIQGVLSRQEIEMTVENFDKAHQFLEALGFQRTMYYEKYRTTYDLDHVLIMLDEMPFGDFVEIEGEDVDQIQAISTRLGLKWAAAIGSGYTALFETIRRELNLRFTDISFENFEGLEVTSDHMDVIVGDE